MDEFVKLVKEMRAAQRNYFKTRNREFLVLSKQLEGQVDQALEDMSPQSVTKGHEENQAESQPGLFERPVTDEEFHPRAMKLIRKRKDFVVMAEDEPYYLKVYQTIREHEKSKGTWSEEDERIYQAAQSVQSTNADESIDA